jgi:GNAT superfamily N-acetyltransferase
MHPFLSQQLAAERRANFLRDAQRAAVVRSARRTSSVQQVRALEPSDIDRLADLYAGLSPRSRFLRFMSPIQSVSESVLDHLANIDHDRHEALGAFDRSGLVASAHWFRLPECPSRADLGIEVTDHYQRQGLGSRLLRLLGRRALARGIVEFDATLLTENTGAIALIRATGWRFVSKLNGPEISYTISIDPKT